MAVYNDNDNFDKFSNKENLYNQNIQITNNVNENQSELESKYSMIKIIGEGTYGIVWQAIRKDNGDIVALKKIRFESNEVVEKVGIPSTAVREILLLRELKHPNVVELIEVTCDRIQLWLVFEYCDTDLRRYLRSYKKKAITITQIKSLLYQLLNGLNYCHKKKILHRDLKPQNILLSSNGITLKIADFGLAKTCSPPCKPNTNEVVTLWYRAPELLLGQKYYSYCIDMWSVGCIMAEMLCGKPIFPGDSEIDTLFHIFRLLGTPNELTWNKVTDLPSYNVNFPQWNVNPRLNLFSLVPSNDSLCVDLLYKLLQYEPEKRISAYQALQHPWFTTD